MSQFTLTESPTPDKPDWVAKFEKFSGKPADGSLFNAFALKTTDEKGVESTDLTALDLVNFRYAPKGKQAFGGHRVAAFYLNSGTLERVVFRTGPLRVSGGLKTFETGGQSLSVDPSDALFEFWHEIDKLNMRTIEANRASWVVGKKNWTPDQLVDLYKGVTGYRMGGDGTAYKQAMSFKVKENKSYLYDRFGGVMPNEDEFVPRDTWMNFEVEYNGLWLGDSKISAGFTLLQGKIVDEPQEARDAVASKKRKQPACTL
jgi:hypothetical protein